MTTIYHNLSGGEFVQDWSDENLIAADDDWDGVPSIVGYRGDGVLATSGLNPSAATGSSTVVDVIANRSDPNVYTTGGVVEFDGIDDAVVGLQGSATADAPYLVIHLDATGRQNVTFSTRLRDIDTGTGAVQQVAVQYRLGDTGAWINVDGGYVANINTGGDTPLTVTLPDAADNQAQIQLRVITADATGSDNFVGVDDILVTSEALGGEPVDRPGTLAIADATVAEDAAAGTISFTVSRTAGSDGAVAATFTVTLPGGSGGADAADLGAGAALTGTVSFADGETEATITLPISADADFEPAETFTVTLSAPTGGAALGDAVATGRITNDDEAPPTPLANVFINEIHYDNTSTDAGEGVEIAGAAGTDLAGYRLVFYTGSTGRAYASGGAPVSGLALSGMIADQQNGFGTLSVPVAGLQNGGADGAEPDGIALVDAAGRVLQFLSYEGSFTATDGAAAGLTSTDIGVAEEPVPAAGLSLQLTGAGSNPADFAWAPASDDSFGQVNTDQTFLSPTGTSQIRALDASVTEGDDGIRDLVFTVRRAGGSALEASVAYQVVLDGTADADDLAADAVLSGTVTFAVGETAKEVRVAVTGDVLPEQSQTLSLILGAVTGDAAILRGTAVGTIINDDPLPLSIMEIQGAALQSAFVGQTVITTGIVTAVDTNGFYLQDAVGDRDAATSDAVFVFTGSLPDVAVGNGVSVQGVVGEFAGSDAGLTVTQIGTPAITVLAATSDLPAALLIGTGGVLPPTQAIDDDGLTVYDPVNDGIDFWESLEGMRVTLDAPQVVADTNGFGETDVVVSNGVGATGVNDRGGITISAGDFNPEKIQIDDDGGVFAGFSPDYTTGDDLSSVTGIVNYAFDRYEVIVTEAVTLTSDVTLAKEQTTLVGDADRLSLASMNVENLAANDPAAKYDVLADNIVFNLRAPDIIAVQEVQDGDGEGNGANLSGAPSAQRLIDAIAAKGGGEYLYVEVAPSLPNSTGGAPNGNIRNGYLYKPERVDYVDGSAALIDDAVYAGTRRPLVAQFAFGGEIVTAIDVHFTSRLGSSALWGDTQPPIDAGDAARTAQAAAVKAYVNDALASDPALNLAVLGDFNGFYFEEAQLQLTDPDRGGVLTNLNTLLAPEERYSYLFEGNAQQIDNVLVTDGLYARAQYDSVHINSQYDADNRSSDHDPQVSLFFIPGGADDETLTGTEDDDRLSGGLGDDRLFGRGGNDNLSGGAGIDRLVGGDGSDKLFVDDADDVVVEAANGGKDRLYATVDYTLAAAVSVETLLVNVAAGLNLTGNELANRMFGNAGDDRLDGGAGADLLDGKDGDDRYVVDDAGDRIREYANNGQDTVETALASYALSSEVETLVYTGDGGFTGDGNAIGNMLTGGALFDKMDGKGGDDTLEGLDGNDRLSGSAGRDTLVGGAGNDTLAGGEDADTLLGGGDNDRLFAKTGDDTLDGGSGDDKLTGDAGADWIVGGTGADRFVFTSLADVAPADGARLDRILDFSTMEGDHIDLRGIDADGEPGDQPFTFIGTDAFTAAGQLRAELVGGVYLVEGDIDGNGAADFTFEVIAPAPLTGSDFLL